MADTDRPDFGVLFAYAPQNSAFAHSGGSAEHNQTSMLRISHSIPTLGYVLFSKKEAIQKKNLFGVSVSRIIGAFVFEPRSMPAEYPRRPTRWLRSILRCRDRAWRWNEIP